MSEEPNPYGRAGVNVDAGDRAVELMKAAVTATHGPRVLGGLGGFAGLFDASELTTFRRPVLATSTDGVGTKVAIAQALDRHDTIGQDLVAMVIDDIVVVGATPLFMTDYIACGKLVPERIAVIVAGIARSCAQAGVALVGGETAEHPGLLAPDEYDVAGAAVGVVEADRMLGVDRVRDGDVVIALASSGLHANGFSLVRRILADSNVSLTAHSDVLDADVGEALLEPTRLYTPVILKLLADPNIADEIHALSHVTGGGIAANLARVLPRGAWVDVDRSTWIPPLIFHVLAAAGKMALGDGEKVWNMGVGFLAIVGETAASDTITSLRSAGIDAWTLGRVSTGARPDGEYEHDTKGVDAGSARLVSSYIAV